MTGAIFFPFQGYKTFYTTNKDKPLENWEVVESDKDATSSVLQDLLEEEPYFIRMKGVGEGGHGVLSPVIQVTTEKKRRYNNYS